jgi:hypothetical protein
MGIPGERSETGGVEREPARDELYCVWRELGCTEMVGALYKPRDRWRATNADSETFSHEDGTQGNTQGQRPFLCPPLTISLDLTASRVRVGLKA